MVESKADIHLSRTLAWLLRHGAVQEGLQFIDGCFLNVDDVLKHRKFRDFRLEDIERVVANDSKRRYELRSSPMDGRHQIRAVQGHSIQVDGLDLVPITLDTIHLYPEVVHGTYTKYWSSIAAQGLKRMKRTHIHFATNAGTDGQVISGLRRSADVVIYADLAKALADGFKFSVSLNNVILCDGDATGTLPPAYFKEVWKLRPYRLLIFANGRPVE